MWMGQPWLQYMSLYLAYVLYGQDFYQWEFRQEYKYSTVQVDNQTKENGTWQTMFLNIEMVT